ncbi:MAG: virulence associated protein [Myxococcaceae bacterium]|nr:virulence associated protein [Myxococcaceae bacterium]
MDPFRDDRLATQEKIQRLEAENAELLARANKAEEIARLAQAGIPNGPAGRPAAVVAAATAFALLIGGVLAFVAMRPSAAVKVTSAPSDDGRRGVAITQPDLDIVTTVPATRPFNRDSAMAALALVDLSACEQTDAGIGHANITFALTGHVAYVDVDAPPNAGTPTARSIEAAYLRAVIPPFAGGPVTLGTRFKL